MKTIKESIKLFGIMVLGIITWQLTSCVTHPRFIDSEIKPLVYEYLKDTNHKKSDLRFYSVKFKSLKDPLAGNCALGFREVYIDPTYWFNKSYRDKKVLVYHEMCHCKSWELHYNKLREDGCSVSLMYPRMPSDRCLDLHWDDYMREFKERCSK